MSDSISTPKPAVRSSCGGVAYRNCETESSSLNTLQLFIAFNFEFSTLQEKVSVLYKYRWPDHA